MNKSLLLEDEHDLRFGGIVKSLNEKHGLHIFRNHNEKSLFKWVCDDKLVNISIFNDKTLIPINFKYIKEGLKSDKKMMFIFIDPKDDLICSWDYKESEVLINYNYGPVSENIEYVSIFNSSTTKL
jgi:hypothetical protein